MGKRVGIENSIAAADAVKMANVDVVAAYPITPQTHIVEHLAELVADGELDAEFIPVESEHSAMSVCCGSVAVGARTFTCTSAQGLALMNEIVFITASMRLPIVMILANRSLSGPLSIWNDHTDVMSVRDCGWIQVFADNGQELFDHVLFAFRVAEDQNVSLPVMINIDGFIVTHVIEPVEYWDEEQVKKYLPDFKPVNVLHPDKPITMGAFGMPGIFSEAKKNQDEALIASKPHIIQGVGGDGAGHRAEVRAGRDLQDRGRRDRVPHDGELQRNRLHRGRQAARAGQVGRPDQAAPVAAVPVRRDARGGRRASRSSSSSTARFPTAAPAGPWRARSARRSTGKEHAGDREFPLRIRGARRHGG